MLCTDTLKLVRHFLSLLINSASLTALTKSPFSIVFSLQILSLFSLKGKSSFTLHCPFYFFGPKNSTLYTLVFPLIYVVLIVAGQTRCPRIVANTNSPTLYIVKINVQFHAEKIANTYRKYVHRKKL